jgi:hypothetical protein
VLSSDWIPPAERDGNDWRIEGIPIPNDTSTDYPQGMAPGRLSFYATGSTENLGGQKKAAAKTCFGLVIVDRLYPFLPTAYS